MFRHLSDFEWALENSDRNVLNAVVHIAKNYITEFDEIVKIARFQKASPLYVLGACGFFPYSGKPEKLIHLTSDNIPHGTCIVYRDNGRKHLASLILYRGLFQRQDDQIEIVAVDGEA